jgi:hypothetical protein
VPRSVRIRPSSPADQRGRLLDEPIHPQRLRQIVVRGIRQPGPAPHNYLIITSLALQYRQLPPQLSPSPPACTPWRLLARRSSRTGRNNRSRPSRTTPVPGSNCMNVPAMSLELHGWDHPCSMYGPERAGEGGAGSAGDVTAVATAFQERTGTTRTGPAVQYRFQLIRSRRLAGGGKDRGSPDPMRGAAIRNDAREYRRWWFRPPLGPRAELQAHRLPKSRSTASLSCPTRADPRA